MNPVDRKSPFFLIRLSFCAGPTLTREDLGLPADWEITEDWINDSRDVPKSIRLSAPEVTLKNPEIPLLPDYSVTPPEAFWKSFPSNYPSTFRKGGVHVERLESLTTRCESAWTLSEKPIARLKGELPVKLIKHLPTLREKNAASVIENSDDGRVGHLVKKGFCGRSF